MMSPAAPGDARFGSGVSRSMRTSMRSSASGRSGRRPIHFLVKGTVVGKSWNRGQILLALSGCVSRESPAQIVAARAVERGRFVRGKVVDRFLDSVLRARVSPQRAARGR